MTLDAASHALFSSLKPLRLRIPGLLDVAVISDPEQIQWMNRHPDVERELDPGASWLHRLLDRRIRQDLGFAGGMLPVFRARADARRAEQRDELEQRFEDMRGAPGEDRESIAQYVSGKKELDDIGAVVQQWCGRLLLPHYRANKDTYAAGKLLSGWVSAPPWTTWTARRNGSLQDAKKAVSEAADGDLHAIHATSIAMENVVKTVRALRASAQASDTKRLAPDDILRTALHAPPAVLRGCSREVKAPFFAEPLTQRTLVVFLVARAFGASGDLDVAFLADGWSRCPAHRVLPEMLRAVWHAAHHDEAEQPGVVATVHEWSRRLNRAVS